MILWIDDFVDDYDFVVDFMKLLLLSYDKNFLYLTGKIFDGSFLICDVSSAASKKIIPKILIVPRMEYERAVKHMKQLAIIQYENRKHLREILKNHLGKKTFANFNEMSVSEFKFINKISKLVDFSNKLHKIRATKNHDEIKIIKRACKITSWIEKKINENLVGKSEEEVSKEIEKLAKEKNCSLSFPPIVASGKNSSFPHHTPGKRKISSNDVVIIDFGITYKNYCTDITRTLLMKNAPKEAKEIYKVVDSARRKILEKIKSGTRVKDLQKISNKLLGQKMIHSVIHSIGLEVHEPIPKKLKENMIICVEPAIYTKNFGIRIENMVLVKKKGCEVLV